MTDKDSLKLFMNIAKLSVEYPDLTPDRLLIIDLEKETLDRIFTQSRVELIRIIKNKKPNSVGELAEILGRPVESISRDLKILSNYGILELIQVGKTKRPVIEKDMLLIPLTT